MVSSVGKWRKRFLWLVVAAVILAGVRWYFSAGNNQEAVTEALSGQGVMTVQERSVIKTISSAGQIVPQRDLLVTFDVAGKVQEVAVSSGDTVAEGAILARLNSVNQELSYLTAKREWELAQFDSPPSIVKERELAYQVAKSELEATTLKAPFSGVVAEVNIDVGEMVSTTTQALRLLDLSRMYLEVNVDEVDIRHVELGQPVTIIVDAYPNLTLTGSVVEIGIVPRGSSDLVLFPVKIELDEVDPRVKPGMSAEGRIVVDRVDGALAVPVDAVAQVDGQSMVTVVTDSGNVPTPVETGISDGMFVEIVSGLKAGDKILANNYRAVARPGSMGRGGPVVVGGVRR